MAQRNPSKITTDLAVDSPLVQNAGFAFDRDDRQYIDNQIRGVEQHLVDALIKNRHATYIRVNGSSASLAAGDVACVSNEQAEPQVTKAVAAALTDAVSSLAVVVRPASPGAMALVAIGGVLPPSVTGLATNSAGYVRANTTTGRCERVASLSAGDYGIGVVSKSGHMQVVPGIGVGATGASSITPGTPGHLTVYDADGETLIDGGAVPSGGATPNGTSGQILTSDGAGDFGTAITPPAGSLVGTTATQTLTGKTINVADNALTATSGATGDVLVHDGTSFVRKAKGADGTYLGVSSGVVGWSTPSGGGSGTFTAGGDLSGSDTSQVVEKVKGTTITTAGGSLPVGAVLRTTAAGVADWGAVDLADSDAVTGTLPSANAPSHSGDVTGAHSATVVEKINGTTVTTAGGGSVGSVLRMTGASTSDWGAVDLADSDAVTGTLPSSNLPTVPISKGGTGLTSIGSANTVFTSNGTAGSWATIVNANIASGAAIAVTKLAGGSSGQFLQMSGSTVTWGAAPSSAPSGTGYAKVSGGAWTTTQTVPIPLADIEVPGSNQQVFFNDGGAWGTHSGITYNKSLNQLLVTNSVVTGKLMTASKVGVDITGSECVIGASAAFGNQFSATRVTGGNYVYLTYGSTNALEVSLTTTRLRSVSGSGWALTATSTSLDTAMPVGGDAGQSKPFRFKHATISSGINVTLTDSQAACPYLTFNLSANIDVTFPGSEGAPFYIEKTGSYRMGILPSAGSALALATTEKSIHIINNGTNYVPIGAIGTI